MVNVDQFTLVLRSILYYYCCILSDYPVECACGQVKTACLVAMGMTQSQSSSGRGRGVAKPADTEEHR